MLIDTHIVHEQDRQYAIELRAALIQQVRAIEQQRAGLLQQIAILERRYNLEKKAGNGNGNNQSAGG
jgi:hypothetical protein